MNTLEAVLEEWETDCQISNHDLADESKNTPTLHRKYLMALSNAKLRLKDAEMKQRVLLKDKWLWYNGKMTKEQIEARGWEYDALDGVKVMKGEMDYYYDSDKDIQESEMKIEYLKTLIDTLKEIVDALKWRHQTIGNMIRWRQFEAGF